MRKKAVSYDLNKLPLEKLISLFIDYNKQFLHAIEQGYPWDELIEIRLTLIELTQAIKSRTDERSKKKS